MKAQLESYFAFLLFPSKPEFLPIYWVASFLCPVYRSVITSEEMPVVRAYLEGMLTVDCWELSSPGPKPLVLNPKPRVLGLTLNCSRPPTTTHPPHNFYA